MVSNPYFIRYAKELAKEHSLFQAAVRAQGGTDAGRFTFPTAESRRWFWGIPARLVYHYCYSAEADIKATVDLAVEVIKNLKHRKRSRNF